VLVVPSFAVLYRLTLSGRLGETAMAAASPGMAAASPGPGAGAGADPAGAGTGDRAPGRLAAATVLALVTAEGVRRWRRARSGRGSH